MATLYGCFRSGSRLRVAGAFVLALVFSAAPALGQFTLLTGTVTDPNGVPYALGTIVPTLVTSATPTFTASGLLYFPPSQASGLDKTGHFLVRIADNTFLTPGGTQWNFTVCSSVGTVPLSFGTGPQCFTLAAPITISGASQDISTNLHAVAPALTLAFGGSGTVGGSGTTNSIPIWTASTTLGNSPITYNGTNRLTSAAALSINPGPNNTNAINLATTYTATNCLGGGSVFKLVANCMAQRWSDNYPADATGDNSTAYFVNDSGNISITGTPAVSAVHGSNFFDIAGGTQPWAVGVVGITGMESAGTASNFGGVYGQAALGDNPANGGTATLGFGIAGQVTNLATSQTQPLAAAIVAYSPSVTAPVSSLGGLLVQDQTPGGANNPAPFSIKTQGTAPNLLQGKVGQIASGNWAGSCTFAAGTTCTCTYASTSGACPTSGVAFASTPVVILTPVNPGATTFTLTSTSSTAFTITASGSNSLVVNWVAFGNPN